MRFVGRWRWGQTLGIFLISALRGSSPHYPFVLKSRVRVKQLP